jgi:8-oxo-dGTP pyrophosphatase MutT (NUDIX family)
MSNQSKIIRAACLAVFNDKKIIMAKGDSKEVYFFVGGGLETGENDIDCLIREVKEEINCEIDKDSIEFLAEFEDIAHGRENTFVQLPFYTATLIGTPTPSNEVDEISYLDTSVDPKHLSAIAINKVYPWLKENGYIN